MQYSNLNPGMLTIAENDASYKTDKFNLRNVPQHRTANVYRAQTMKQFTTNRISVPYTLISSSHCTDLNARNVYKTYTAFITNPV